MTAASASGFTPFSTICTQVASVDLSSGVFSNWDISYKISRVSSADEGRSVSLLEDMKLGISTVFPRFFQQTMTTRKSTSAKKEKLFHPSSRKAGQLTRKAIRQTKLSNILRERHKKHNASVDLYGFFYNALPEEGVLTLEDLHQIVQDVWLTRFDGELEIHRSARRSGRPKSTKEMKLEELILREAETYRTGMEVIDLTHPPTVELFREWDQKEVAYIQLLRFIRIFSTDPNLVVVSRIGKHASIIESSGGSDITSTLTAIHQEDLSRRP